jgi:uncharacterized protein YdcH (DUF465 family)
MADPIRDFVERFPEGKDLIDQLRSTNSTFNLLCEEHLIVNDKLDALKQLKGADAKARARALQERRMSIEEELLTAIEGYQPA